MTLGSTSAMYIRVLQDRFCAACEDWNLYAYCERGRAGQLMLASQILKPVYVRGVWQALVRTANIVNELNGCGISLNACHLPLTSSHMLVHFMSLHV